MPRVELKLEPLDRKDLMTRLTWNKVGSRRYHVGVDRGVLAVDGKPVVPWDGLLAVEERSEKTSTKSYYLEGRKNLITATSGDFSASITAFSSPSEFDECDGMVDIGHGILASNQRRKTFNFAYRTLNGNDILGTDHGYTLHLVYNALAEPTTRQNKTLNDDISVQELTWDVITKPSLSIAEAKPTSHYQFDSQKVPSKLLKAIEDILYGTATSDPSFPSMVDIINNVVKNPPIVRRNELARPRPMDLDGSVYERWNAYAYPAAGGVTNAPGLHALPQPGWYGGETTQVDKIAILSGRGLTPLVIGAPLTIGLRYKITASPGNDITHATITYAEHSTQIGKPNNGAPFEIRPIVNGREEVILLTGVATKNQAYGYAARIMITLSNAQGDMVTNNGTISIMATDAFYVYGEAYEGPSFDGDTVDPSGRSLYNWEGTPLNSSSVMRSWY